MFKINNVELRNLEEQVQKNKEDIAKHWSVDRVLADFGIKMLGRFDSYDDIKDFDEGDGFGNAYLIGTEEPYDVYVWTRPDENAGQPVAYWLDIGPISLVGPQGPEGPKGDTGATGASTRWYSGTVLPPQVNTTVPGTFYLHTASGNIYETNDSGDWVLAGNIKGPQGIQGIQGIQGERGEQGPAGPAGPTGDAGGFIHIVSKLSTEDALPTPSSLGDLTIAYLVGENEDLYIQIGETSATAMWNNVGPLNVATLVTVDGQYQNTWDADTKVDKFSDASGFLRVYAAESVTNRTIPINIATSDNGWQPSRVPYLLTSTAGKNQPTAFLITNDPVNPYHCANKNYVDTTTVPDQRVNDPNYGGVQALVLNAKTGSNPRQYGLFTIATSTGGILGGRLAQYQGNTSGAEGTDVGNGRLLQLDPVQPLQVANKRYVDSKVKTYRHQINGSANDRSGAAVTIDLVVYTNSPDSIITPDTTTESFMKTTFVPKYMDIATVVMSTKSNTEAIDMIKDVTATYVELMSGSIINYSSFSGFLDAVTEI